jgi:hypothetical protein
MDGMHQKMLIRVRAERAHSNSDAHEGNALRNRNAAPAY